MKVIGITGGIGSGKTTVCRMLEGFGARVFYADEWARRIMVEDDDVRSEISSAFGDDIYSEDGILDRKRLAGRLFGDPEAVARVGVIVHPRVHAAFAEWVSNMRREGVPLVAKEAALMFQPGGTEGLDLVVAIVAPEEIRVQRASARDGSDQEAIRHRARHQLEDDEFRARADRVVTNNGSLLELAAQVRVLWLDLVGPSD